MFDLNDEKHFIADCWIELGKKGIAAMTLAIQDQVNLKMLTLLLVSYAKELKNESLIEKLTMAGFIY